GPGAARRSSAARARRGAGRVVEAGADGVDGAAGQDLLDLVVQGVGDEDVAGRVHRHAVRDVEAKAEGGGAGGGEGGVGRVLEQRGRRRALRVDGAVERRPGRRHGGGGWGGDRRRGHGEQGPRRGGDGAAGAGGDGAVVVGGAGGQAGQVGRDRRGLGAGQRRGRGGHRRRRQLHHPAVAVVGDEDVAGRVHRHAVREVEAGAEGHDGAVGQHLLDGAVEGVGDADVA